MSRIVVTALADEDKIVLKSVDEDKIVLEATPMEVISIGEWGERKVGYIVAPLSSKPRCLWGFWGLLPEEHDELEEPRERPGPTVEGVFLNGNPLDGRSLPSTPEEVRRAQWRRTERETVLQNCVPDAVLEDGGRYRLATTGEAAWHAVALLD